MKIRKAIIPAAGWGTRLLPATKSLPKEMLTIVDRPSIHYVVEEAVRAGIEQVIIITGRNKDAIADYFDRSPDLERHLAEAGKADVLQSVLEPARMARICYVRQQQPRGLGDAILAAAPVVGDEPFAVLLPDELLPGHPPCLARLLAYAEEDAAALVAVQEVPLREVSRYGIIKPVGNLTLGARVIDLMEKPSVEQAPSRWAVIGRYVLPPDVFPLLAGLPTGADGEVQLTDALRALCRRADIYAVRWDGERYDVGTPAGLVRATVSFALARSDLAAGLSPFVQDLAARLRVRSTNNGQACPVRPAAFGPHR